MARFLLRRLLLALALVALASSAALLLTRLAPGDITAQLGPFASRAEVERTRAEFDLDRNPLVQWGIWAGRAVRLDFGRSFLYNRPIRPLVLRSAGNTALLGIVALLIATVIGVPLGIYTGVRNSGVLPSVVRGGSLVCLSLPPLLTSLGLVFVAARTGWLPTGGMVSPTGVDPDWPSWIADVLRHLPLPAFALAVPMAATFERLQSQAMTEAVQQPFLSAAMARGASPRRLVLRHAWPVSLRAMCAIYGLAIGALLSGSFIVEYVTAWPGLGRLMYEGLRARDVYLVAACTAMGTCLLALGTLGGDLLLAFVDPRVRQES
jgi:peptide/nickel transport system permease protein